MLKNFKYGTFGFKKEWLEYYLNGIIDLENTTFLGPRQIESLKYYLKDFELIKGHLEDKDLYSHLHTIYSSKGIDCPQMWSILWINLTFNSALFTWWQKLKNLTFSRNELFDLMCGDFGKKNRYVLNGLTSLISTFEYTPIGYVLRIGVVTREKNNRFVRKEGGYPFDAYVVLYALYKFAHKKNAFLIDIEQIGNEIFSPQKVLVVETKYVKKVLVEMDEPDLLKTQLQEQMLIAELNQEVHPYEILKRFIQREKI